MQRSNRPIFLENVHCPREKCLEPDDCWFNVRLQDEAMTSVSHLVAWIEVHAETGDVRWKDYEADGGPLVRVEPMGARMRKLVRR